MPALEATLAKSRVVAKAANEEKEKAQVAIEVRVAGIHGYNVAPVLILTRHVSRKVATMREWCPEETLSIMYIPGEDGSSTHSQD